MLFLIVNRSGCFAVSDQPTISELLDSAIDTLDGTIKVQVPISYHVGVRLQLCLCACLTADTRDVFSQLISVRCPLSFIITLVETNFC
jgi:hypothetical protein